MTRLNPTTIRWQAPTQNVDGSLIDYELAYELYVDAEPVATFPGRLNPDGTYEQDVVDLFPDTTFAAYDVALKAFRVDQPEEKSALSNVVEYKFDRRKPKAPFLLD